MSQQNFMRNLRMTMPQYVTNVTSYGDAVRILKNKGILNETLIKQLDKAGLEEAKPLVSKEDKIAVIKEWISLTCEGNEDDINKYSKMVDMYFADKEDVTEKDFKKIWAKVTEKYGVGDMGADWEAFPETWNDVQNGTLVNENNSEFLESLNEAGLEEDYDDYMDYRDEEEAEAKEDERIDNMINQKLEDEYEEKMKKSIAAADAAIERGEEEDKPEYLKTWDVEDTLNEGKSKWENTSGKSMYAQFKEIDNLNGQEVLIGIDFEIERNHELSKTEAIKLVLKNLKKNPIYYTATLMAGKEMTEIPTIGKLKPGSDKMRELKGENSLVDKDNGMKPVKDVEKVKASSNKAKKETNKPEGNISLMSLVAKASRGVQKMNATGEKMKVVKENLEMQGDFKVGDKVMVNPDFPEAADATRLKIGEIYTITNFRIYKKGSLLQNVDALLDNEEEINIDYLIKAPSSVPSSIFSRNAGISQKLKSLSADDLMEMIREELSEYFDGRDNLTDVTGENK